MQGSHTAEMPPSVWPRSSVSTKGLHVRETVVGGKQFTSSAITTERARSRASPLLHSHVHVYIYTYGDALVAACQWRHIVKTSFERLKITIAITHPTVSASLSL